MLSSKLIRLIEDHWDPIANRILAEICHDPRLKHMASLPAGDLRERARDILQRLGHWLSVSNPTRCPAVRAAGRPALRVSPFHWPKCASAT